MKPEEPNFEIKESGGFFFPTSEALMGGYAVGGYRERSTAECYANNMKYMFRQGWRAREEELRKTLGLSSKEGT